MLPTLPKELNGRGVRVLNDGSYYIPRRNRDLEKIMDSLYMRVPRQRKWFPATINKVVFGPLFEGKTINIVGKGVSLDRLEPEDFVTESPIIGINEAARSIEHLELHCPLFAIQLDSALGATCLPESPTSRLFISNHAKKNYEPSDRVIVFCPEAYGLHTTSLSVQCAMAISIYLGAKGFRLLAFDGALRINTDYARSIGYSSIRGGSPERFTKHRIAIVASARGLPIEWVKPGIQDVPSRDISQQ